MVDLNYPNNIENQYKITIKDLSLTYSDGTESLKNITMGIPENSITVIFGPAGGGKSSFLRILNRLNDLAKINRLRPLRMI